MDSWLPSFFETMGFSGPSDAAPNRRPANDGRGLSKAARCRPVEYRRAADAYKAGYESQALSVQEILPAEIAADYEYISDSESLSFDGLNPVLPSTTTKQTLPPTKQLLSALKATSPPPQAAVTPPRPSTSKAAVQTAPVVPGSPSAPWARGTTLAQKWSTRPNKRAREIVSDVSNPRTSIVNEVQEPEYALRDAEISEGLDELKNLMCEFGEAHFRFEIKVSSALKGRQIGLTPTWFAQFSQETAKVVACVASGGPGGVQGWHELFIEPVKRMGVVLGIVGNVLVEQVFEHMLFGGAERHVAELVELQKKYADEDGFVRNTHYATYIRSILDPKTTGSFMLPSNFANHVNHIVAVLATHLEPIVKLDPSSPSIASLIPKLHSLITHAGLLSLNMRADPHTVYHFTPVFKEESFSPARMECFNGLTMEQTNPRTSDEEPGLFASEKIRRAKLSEAEKKRSRNDDALTQITIMSGVMAYRLGGWEDFDSKVTNVQYERMEYATEGVRERVLSKAWTYCRWGRARAFKDGKADDVAAHHGTAWKGGFAEFADVDGVKDWLAMERAETKKAREADIQAQLNEEHRARS